MKVIETQTVPIKLWAENTEEGCLEQARNLASLPFVKEWVALMPDAHQGYGMPIGGVIATDRVVIPNAVGVDIGCGMKARKTNLTELDKETLKKILNQIQRDVPTGFSHHGKDQEMSSELLSRVQEMSFDNEELRGMYRDMGEQMGTLGGGNHFIEIQRGDDGHIWIMLHSGSRGIGKKTCDYYNKIAEELNTQWYSQGAEELAFLPLDIPQGQEYLVAMRIAMQFAEENRLMMLERVTAAIAKFVPNMEVEEAIDTHHNYASMEHHFGKDYLVHRKGAVRAIGKVIIPGSMGTFSYIGEGLENPQSFCSCAHGAGRRMGRKEAMRQFTAQSVLEEMKQKDIELFKVKKEDVAEECSASYKDIDVVMENQKDLVRPLVKLRPLGVVKG